MRNLKVSIVIFVTLIIFILLTQMWMTFEFRQESEKIYKQSENINSAQIPEEKLRQEIITLKIENEKKTLFWQLFFTNFGAAISIIVASIGGWIAFNQYLSNRKKENSDKNSQLFSNLFEGVFTSDIHISSASITGLIQFLESDKIEFHDRVALTLSSIGRIEKSKIVEEAFINVFISALEKIPEVLRQVSWQGFRINKSQIKFSRANNIIDLSGFDFRDACFFSDFKNRTDFTNTCLSNTDFRGAILKACDFMGVNMEGANLEYADLSFSNFKNTNLSCSILNNIKVEELNLDGANLSNVSLTKYNINWELIKNKWSIKNLSKDITSYLELNYYPEPTGKKVLILLSEFPPYVKGGLWTAVYHQIINTRRKGANLIIMAPISKEELQLEIFGIDINVIPINQSLSDISSYSRTRTGTQETKGLNPYSTFDRKKISEYTSAVYKTICELNIEFDIIHAHDWVTFSTASFLSNEFNKKWIAHFHSLESDRNKKIDKAIALIEKQACENSYSIAAPSSKTQKKLIKDYCADIKKINIIPNCFSKNKFNLFELGSFNSKKIGFAGRLTWQKGSDIFIDIAERFHEKKSNFSFVMYGTGEDRYVNYLKQKATKTHTILGNNNSEIIEPNTKRRIEFVSIISVDYVDFPIKKYRYKGEYTKYKIEEIALDIINIGFEATPLSRDDLSSLDFKFSYTPSHLIKTNKEEYYIVLAAGLRKYEEDFVKSDRFVSFQEYKDWFKRFDIFENLSVIVVPSRYEPFGMIVFEAMQAGVPVIFDKKSGIADFIESDFIVDSSKLDIIEQKLIELLSNEKLWLDTQKKQYEQVAKFNEKNYENYLIELWNKN